MNLKLDALKNVVFFSILIGVIGIFSLIVGLVNGYIVIPPVVYVIFKFIIMMIGVRFIAGTIVFYSNKYMGFISGVGIAAMVWWVKYFVSIGVV